MTNYVKLEPEQFEELLRVIREGSGGGTGLTPEEHLALKESNDAVNMIPTMVQQLAVVGNIDAKLLNLQTSLPAIKNDLITTVDNTNLLETYQDNLEVVSNRVSTLLDKYRDTLEGASEGFAISACK